MASPGGRSVRDVKERRSRPQGRGRGTGLTETESRETASARDQEEGNGPGILPRARPDPASQADALLQRQHGKTLPSLSGWSVNRDTCGRIFGELVPRSSTPRATRNSASRPQRRGALPGGQEGGPDHMLAGRGLHLGGGRSAGQEPLPQTPRAGPAPVDAAEGARPAGHPGATAWGCFSCSRRRSRNRPKVTGDQDQGVNIRVTEA